jgi:hypothetical protein
METAETVSRLYGTTWSTSIPRRQVCLDSCPSAPSLEFLDWLEGWEVRQPQDHQLPRCVLRENRPCYEQQLEHCRQMSNALAASRDFTPPTAVLGRGIAYREMLLQKYCRSMVFNTLVGFPPIIAVAEIEGLMRLRRLSQ